MHSSAQNHAGLNQGVNRAQGLRSDSRGSAGQREGWQLEYANPESLSDALLELQALAGSMSGGLGGIDDNLTKSKRGRRGKAQRNHPHACAPPTLPTSSLSQYGRVIHTPYHTRIFSFPLFHLV